MPVINCDECEREFDSVQGLTMHKTRTHRGLGQKGRPPKASAGNGAKKPRKKPQEAALRFSEQWSDGNGRMMVQDQNGGLWLMKRVD